jgi:beta-glucuronidase
MRRTFDEHASRTVVRLDGLWDFAQDADGIGEKKKWFRKFPSGGGRMAVPGCWNTSPRLFDYHGKGWYRRLLRVPAGTKHLVLVFEGTGGALSVWLDGHPLGRNPVSCLPWTVQVPQVVPGEHELVVEVDSSKSLEDVFPRYGNDWAHYGGLVRPVEAAFLNDIWIQELRLPYTLSARGVTLTPEIVIANLGAETRTERLVLEIDGEVAAEWPVRLPAGKTVRIRHELPPRKLALWSPEQPVLHTVRAACGGDDLADRTGFRSIVCRGRQILINGVPVKILGVNRHHEYGDNGFAVPPDIVLRDFELIRDLGCNAVRCHYPVDSLAMDLCDELGLLVWSEIPFYGRWTAVVGDPVYRALAGTAIERMIARDFNRPAVFVWSVMNECATDTPDGVQTATHLVRRVRKLDRTRPVSYASNRLTTDGGLKLLDLVGLNAYPGWYDDKKRPATWPPLIEQMDAKLRREPRGIRPMLVTETGGAALYGDRSLEDRKWSERFQADLLEKHLRALLGDPRVAGVFIWQFADIRTITEYWSNRPGLFNNKGLLDRFRRPKESYWRVRNLYSEFAARTRQARRKGARR